MIIKECQKILPLSILACSQTFEKSDTIVNLQKQVEALRGGLNGGGSATN